MPAPGAERVRLHEIDGLRGWAALSVVLFHLFWEMFGQLQPAFRSPFLALLLDGRMDVAVFFVLSGDALSAAYWMRQSRASLARLAVKRYFRLGVPIFASSLIVFVLMKTGLIFSHQAAAMVGREDWLGLFLHYNYSVVGFIRYTAFGVFFNQTATGSLNPFLWPMQVELLGSILVFCYLLLDAHIRLKSVFLVFMLLVCLGGTPSWPASSSACCAATCVPAAGSTGCAASDSLRLSLCRRSPRRRPWARISTSRRRTGTCPSSLPPAFWCSPYTQAPR